MSLTSTNRSLGCRIPGYCSHESIRVCPAYSTVLRRLFRPESDTDRSSAYYKPDSRYTPHDRGLRRSGSRPRLRGLRGRAPSARLRSARLTGRPRLVTSFVTGGKHAVRAVFRGNATHAPSASADLTVTVQATAPKSMAGSKELAIRIPYLRRLECRRKNRPGPVRHHVSRCSRTVADERKFWPGRFTQYRRRPASSRRGGFQQ
jgi:hypothetical protein